MSTLSPSSLYSCEQVAEQLGLHVRTIRKYVRDGQLPAVRVGKSYRIARPDLESFLGQQPGTDPPAEKGRDRHVEVSCVVEVDSIPREPANRLTSTLLAAAKGHDHEKGDLRIVTQFNPERERLKVILTGGADQVSVLLAMVASQSEPSP